MLIGPAALNSLYIVLYSYANRSLYFATEKKVLCQKISLHMKSLQPGKVCACTRKMQGNARVGRGGGWKAEGGMQKARLWIGVCPVLSDVLEMCGACSKTLAFARVSQ